MTEYAALLAELAVPRLAGTPAHAHVREVLKRELRARGFAVEEHPFTARPAALLRGAPRIVNGLNLVAQHAPAAPPAAPPSAPRPAVWLVAHYDTKGQPISMALRLCAAAALVFGVVLVPVTLVPGLVMAAAGALVLTGNRVTNRSSGAVDNATGVLAVFMVLDLLAPRAGREGGGTCARTLG
ncbi:MAG: hypothetical protein ACREME_06780 [Gemmatimonadales bacterium]